MVAAMNGHLEAVKLLLDHGVDINAQIETNKKTAVTLACVQSRSEVVPTLLDPWLNVKHWAKTGLTPLIEAASGGYVDVGRIRYQRTSSVPSSRDTALTIASDKGHKIFVELILIDLVCRPGCNSGHLDVLQKLIDYNGDPTIPDARNCSPLMASFKKGNQQISIN